MAQQPPNNCSGAYPLFGDKYIQFGTFSPFKGDNTDASTASIRTNLASIDFGMATISDSQAGAIGTDAGNSYIMSVDYVIASGACTLTRGTNGAADVPVSYVLIGTQNASD